MRFKPINIIKNQFEWAKDHPVEAVLLGAGVGVGASFLPAMFAAEAGAGAGTLALETGGPAMLGADVATGASLGTEAAAGTGTALGTGEAVSGLAASHLADESALLSGYPVGESVSGAAASHLLGPYAAPSADPAMLGGNTPLSSPYSGWWDKVSSTVGNKLKDPKTVMQLGMMAASMGSHQQGGPMPYPQSQSMQSASRSQEQITKDWLLKNDPDTYRRIYGNPQQGVA